MSDRDLHTMQTGLVGRVLLRDRFGYLKFDESNELISQPHPYEHNEGRSMLYEYRRALCDAVQARIPIVLNQNALFIEGLFKGNYILVAPAR
jgi:hypothetical protein